MRQMEDLAVQLRVHVRDRLSGTAIGDFTESEWVSTFHSRMSEVIGSWSRTFGGSLILGGSTEEGRVTVYDSAAATTPLVDLDWFTWTVQLPENSPPE